MSKSSLIVIAICFSGAFAACARPAVPILSACDTLSKEAVTRVQAEEVVETTSSQRSSGGLTVSQCFYKLPTYSRSVNLEVTSGPRAAIDEFWNKRFHEHKMTEEEEEEIERGQKEGMSSDADKDKKPAGPEPVPRLGDEAFWIASQINGSLFVRRRAAVYRISMGGPEDSNVRLQKAVDLANSFLRRPE